MSLKTRLRRLENTSVKRPTPSAEEVAKRNRSSLEEVGAEYCADVLVELRRHAPSTFRGSGEHGGELDASDDFLAEVQRAYERKKEGADLDEPEPQGEGPEPPENPA